MDSEETRPAASLQNLEPIAQDPDEQPTSPDLLGGVATVHMLDPSVIGLWRVQGFIKVLTFILPMLFAMALVAHSFLGLGMALVIATGGSVVFSLQALVWPPLSYARYRFAIREHDLWIRRGVLFHTETVIPLTRIQHVDSRQGPLERLWGLSRVLVYTASGLAPDGGIPGLRSQVAAALRDDLALRGGYDGV